MSYAARSRTYVSPGATLRYRNPLANALRNAPEWTDEFTGCLRTVAGWRDNKNRISYIREGILTGSTAEANYEMLRRIHAYPPEAWPAYHADAGKHKYAEVVTGETPVTAIKSVLIEVLDPGDLWKYLDGGAGMWWASEAHYQLRAARRFIRALRNAFPGEFQDPMPIAVVTPASGAKVVRRHQLGGKVAETRAVGSKLRVVDYV